MAKLDARRIAGFLAEPGDTRVVLLHGEDQGLVRERGAGLVQRVAEGDAFRMVDVAREAAVKDAGLLAAEASTPALTGGRRIVRVRDATDGLTAAAKAACAGRGPGIVLLEAGELAGNKGLRLALEKHEAAAVIACYPETGAALESSVAACLTSLGARAEPAALAWLAARLGEDRMVMRRELEKLALYVGPGVAITEEDAASCIAGGAALDMDEALLAASGGDVARADSALDAAFAEGANAVQLVRATLRHMQRLQAAADAVAGGASPGHALAGLRPPVFFKQRGAMERALRLWSPQSLAAAGAALLEAERRTKTTGMPDVAVARNAVLGIARMAARRR
ncbi:MAG: polymerase delta subunit [Rhodospirillales bacterium]|nr:polymerase delta subunit [Rhodospirillales bacterium]